MAVQISDNELAVMKVLWGESPLPYSEIGKRMKGNSTQLKTLLQRLTAKGAVEAIPLGKRLYHYRPLVAQGEYTAQSRRHFLDKVFDGSRQAMLMNFVMEEEVTLEDLQSLMDMLKEGR